MKRSIYGLKIGFALLVYSLLSIDYSLDIHAAEPSLFDQAAAKYKAADFRSAADLYQKQIQAGSGTSAVYYNLGNSVLRLGQKGMALVYYERALKANPRDKDARWNIQVLKSSLVDRIQEPAPNVILEPIKNVLDHIKVDEIAIAFTVFLALFSISALLIVLLASSKNLLLSLRTLALVGLMVSGALFGWKVWLTKDARAVVQEKEVIARYGPSDQESKALVLHEGALGKVIDESGEWIYLQLANKNMGWIRKSACEII